MLLLGFFRLNLGLVRDLSSLCSFRCRVFYGLDTELLLDFFLSLFFNLVKLHLERFLFRSFSVGRVRSGERLEQSSLVTLSS